MAAAAVGGRALSVSAVDHPGLPRGPVDHAWVDDGHGVLSCVAGHQHSAAEIVACPYYFRSDVVEALGSPPAAASLTLRGERYAKITEIAGAVGWAQLVAALPARHGLRSCSWSLFSRIDRTYVKKGIDPRDALANAIDVGPGLLRALTTALGDTRNEQGTLGLTGSAAIDPSGIRASDLDLLAYSPEAFVALVDAIAALGGTVLANLERSDARYQAYVGSRWMPRIADSRTAHRAWSRRRDVAWVDGIRIDLGLAHPDAALVPALPYSTAPVGQADEVVAVSSVDDAYPVRLATVGRLRRVVITARGFQDTLRSGDRLRLRGALHRSPAGWLYASIDDAAGHSLELVE